jgi:signal transduction histidine kinase
VVAVPVLYDDYSYFYCVEIIYILYICVTCCVGICIAVDGCVKNKHEANILFIGCIFLFCIGIWEMLMVLDIIHIKANFVIYIEDYIFLLFIFSMLYALLSRFVRVHNKVKLLTYNIISAHEEERRRLARELHDGFGQNLQAIKLHLHKIGHALTKQNIKKIVNEVTLAIEELRSICTALRPPFLDEMGIGTALKLYAQKFSRATGLNINVKNISDPFLPRPASEIEDNLFRIAQEALNNVAKHSRAENVIISLKRNKKNKIVMKIIDDGIGINLSPSSSFQGIGLSTIRERVILIHGRLIIKTKRGTMIKVEVPDDNNFSS